MSRTASSKLLLHPAGSVAVRCAFAQSPGADGAIPRAQLLRIWQRVRKPDIRASNGLSDGSRSRQFHEEETRSPHLHAGGSGTESSWARRSTVHGGGGGRAGQLPSSGGLRGATSRARLTALHVRPLLPQGARVASVEPATDPVDRCRAAHCRRRTSRRRTAMVACPPGRAARRSGCRSGGALAADARGSR